MYQPINCLIDIAETDDVSFKISSEIEDNNWTILSKDEAYEKGFQELSSWSTKDDYLTAIELENAINDEYYVLVCLPKKDFQQYTI